MTVQRSLRNNSIANYLGVGYSTIIGIVVLPLYLQYLGPEGFGLVGVFTMLQSWSRLLDMGMSTLVSREAAKARGKKAGFGSFRKVLRSLELISLVVMLSLIVAFLLASGWLASEWFFTEQLQHKEVAICLVLMACDLAVRIPSLLYKGGIRGLERQVLLNVVSVLIVTLRFFGALLLLAYITNDVISFFAYQLLISLVELIIIGRIMYRFTIVDVSIRLRMYWSELRPIITFAGSIAYLGVIWGFLTQIDKLILSKILPLSEYGFFTLIMILCGGIFKLSSPIAQAILPRLTYLVEKNDPVGTIALYRKATQWVASLLLPVAGTVALYGSELVYAWTGNMEASVWVEPLMPWFAAGSGIIVLSSFQYYLQYAYGQLRLHVIFSTVAALILVPLIIVVAFRYGPMGVAITWFGYRVVLFLFWTPYVHAQFAPGLHLKWVGRDIFPALLGTLLALWLSTFVAGYLSSPGRLVTLFLLMFLVLLAVGLNLMLASKPRKMVLQLIRRALG